MGQLTYELVGPGTNELTRNTFATTEGILYSVSFRSSHVAFKRFINWVEIGVVSYGASPEVAAAVLCNGHLGPIGSIGWSGRFPLSTDDMIYVDTWGQWTANPTVSMTIFKPDPNKSSMEVLDA